MRQSIIANLGVKPIINPIEEIDIRVNFIKNYLIKSGCKGLILGISGGQDSTLCGKLCQMAIERINSSDYEFKKILLPYNIQRDINDAKDACKFIGGSEYTIINISNPVDETRKLLNLTDFHKGNVKARTRMIVQYAIAGESNLLVVGTDHASEAISGFFTKYGDGASDINPLHGLNKRQGKLLLETLECPCHLYQKIPTADLLDNNEMRSDEDELGLTYDQIDDYLENKELSEDIITKIEKLYITTRHKRVLPVTPLDMWWQ